jgi:hypothetical protein
MRMFIFLASLLLVGACTSPKKNSSPFTASSNIQFAPPVDYVPLSQIQIKQTFDVVTLSQDNLESEQIKCVPFLVANSENMRRNLKDFPLKNATVTVSHKSSSKVFVYHNTKGLCLEYSANKFPIYAVETLLNTANPTGVPDEIGNEWYKKIAKQIAIKGKVKVIYQLSKENALVSTYWNDPAAGIVLNYSAEFKKAGEWESLPVDFKFSHPELRGYSESKRGDKSVKNFPLANEF